MVIRGAKKTVATPLTKKMTSPPPKDASTIHFQMNDYIINLFTFCFAFYEYGFAAVMGDYTYTETYEISS